MAMSNGTTNGHSDGPQVDIELAFEYKGRSHKMAIRGLTSKTFWSAIDAAHKLLDERGATEPAPPAPVAQLAAPSPASNEPPICEFHGTPMKASKKPGAWFCPKKKPNGEYCPFTIGE